MSATDHWSNTLGVTEPARLAVVPAAHPFVLGRREFVESLVLDQQAEPVAEVEQFRRGRIVAGADGIDADFFQHAQPPLQHLSGTAAPRQPAS